ncbi:phosphoribosyltransferase [Halorubrum saccharovorum DSM 1137]|uniref:Phosphoribosyltransferase n=1 Tax=Halorubrum saccharovorum DSM 1137 TaxID=1227484 RepID=M0DM31_9EURY|nr:phosphoribosyltransferase family protein [Halorubrum saccharovorum]ELZ36536.1 phosphoribosyltransferase [Halorubrum saccharovorum DSM 1137]
MFTDRADAGEQLASMLEERGVDADIVLGIPRGGLPAAAAVAERLGVPLDVIVAKKIAHPGNPEYAVGAVTADDVAWYDDEPLRQLGLDEDELDDERERARQRAEEKLDGFQDGRPPVDLEGKHVLIVDDGVATGATMRSCVRTAKDGGASRVTVAVPVAPSTRVPELEREADAVITLRAPERFTAVGRFHQTFDQVSTEEAVEYLEASAAPR